MAKCGDCLYFGLCKNYIDPEETFPEIDGGCLTFKSKADFVEVVRCKDCVYGKLDKAAFYHDVYGNENDTTLYHCLYGFGHNKGEHFCSYGERKDNERKAD